MKIFYSDAFKKDFADLPNKIKKIAERKIKIFGDNYRHPSLGIKKMEGLQDIWEGKITNSYRFTFILENNSCILRRIGAHDILRKEK